MYVSLRERRMAYESRGSDRLMGTIQTGEQVLLLAVCPSQSWASPEFVQELLKLTALRRDSQ